MAFQQAFDSLANVLQEMPSIGDLLRLGRELGGRLRVGRGAVAAHQFDAGMGRQPSTDGRGVAIGQEIDDIIVHPWDVKTLAFQAITSSTSKSSSPLGDG